MPLTKSAHTRFRIINKCLTDRLHKFPSLDYLARKCSALLETSVSVSCIEKDLRAMKQPQPRGYDAPIEYSHAHKGYYYTDAAFSIDELNLDDEEWLGLRYAAAMLYQYKDIPVFKYFTSAIERINSRFSLGIEAGDPGVEKWVQYEQGQSTTGYQWLKELYQAIDQRFLVSFTYENIYKQEKKQYRLQPCLLREMRNRWYVIGWSEERQRYLTFALDRIEDLQTGTTKQKRRSDFDPDKQLRHSIGIMETENGTDTVEMDIRAPFHRLVELEPLHQSQQIIKTGKNQIRIRMQVDVNPELLLRILAFGPHATVLKPKTLVTQIKEAVTAMAKNYS